MTEPLWLEIEQILVFHRVLIEMTGGSHGVRDEGLLASALARPQNLYAYEDADIFALAASYAEGVAHNHPFVDGNKRAAFMAADVFLRQNGFQLQPDAPESSDIMVNLANHAVTREAMAAYLRKHSDPLPPDEV